MTNRYDRDPDEYGRREPSHDDERRRAEARGRYGDERTARQTPWRGGQHERGSEADWRGQEWRGHELAGRGEERGRDERFRDERFRDDRFRDERWRQSSPSENDNYSARQASSGRDAYSSGRDDSERYDRWREDGRRDERPGYRGYYQEQVWTRDPRSGNVYGYEYSTRMDPRRFNAGDESHDRWRSDTSDQNRRFDIDRGYRGTSGYGTSGYGNTTRGQGQSMFGKGPKGYVRSDERIREDVCDRLSDDDEVDASDITVTVKNAEVILEGTVIDRRTKHRAEDIAESVSGVKDVTNHLRARKGLLQELGDKLAGNDDAEHHGHSGSGTRNSTSGNAPKTAH